MWGSTDPENLVRRLIPLILALGLLVTGCKLRADASLVISEDESGTLGLEVSLDEELRDVLTQQGGTFDITASLDQLPESWTVEQFADSEFEGVRAAAEFASFDDLEEMLRELAGSRLGNGASPDELLSNIELRHEGDRFTFEASIDDIEGTVGEALGGEEAFGGFDLATLFDTVFEIRLIVTLPGTVESHNGDALDLSTVTWNIDLEDAGRTLRAESVVSGGGPNLAIVGLIVALVVLAVVGFVLAQRRNQQRARELLAATSGGETIEEPPGR